VQRGLRTTGKRGSTCAMLSSCMRSIVSSRIYSASVLSIDICNVMMLNVNSSMPYLMKARFNDFIERFILFDFVLGFLNRSKSWSSSMMKVSSESFDSSTFIASLFRSR
jgi:hypothetical protein